MFDTLGTLIGVASKADMLDKDGKLPKIKGALLSDAVGTSVGAVCGTSTVTTFVESASGVAEGGRTGLTAIVAAILFGLSLFLSPIFLAIPSFATAPALIVVGFLMLTSITKIDFNDYTEAIPCFIAIIAMPFMYSISEGIAMGVISYVVINLISRKSKGKENQRTDVCSYGSLYPEICVLIKEPPGTVQNTEYASDTVQITAFYAAAHKIPVRI